MAEMTESPVRPRSAVHPATGLFGVAGMAAGLTGLAVYDVGLNQAQQALALCLCAALPMMLVDCLAFRVYRSGIGRYRGKRRDYRRIAVKLIGLYAAFALIALGYWLFPEYAGRFYEPYFYVLGDIWPWLVVLAVPYFLWLDPRMQAPVDGCWHAGMAVLGRWRSVDPEPLWQFARSWLIKAFFLPLMFVLLTRSVSFVLREIGNGALSGQAGWFGLLFELTFTVDLVFVCVGYALTFRILNSHIRSAEPSLLGWAVTLACYQPFWGLINGQFLAYDDDGFGWRNWLSDSEPLIGVWAAAILGLSAFYAWASVAFGLRFSNLTHRGIITAGPYRVTKHPAYIAKNASWWLIAVPFIAAGPWHEALRHCLLLLLVNVLYYLRARTEERHLAQDPVYVQYAFWMEDNGWLRKLGRWWPRAFAFRWRDPADARAALGLN